MENVAKKYFEKPYILLDLLNQHKELSTEEIIKKMKISKTTANNLIKEFNRKEKAIHYNGKYYTNKKHLVECESYKEIISMILLFEKDLDYYLNENEKILSEKLNVERKTIQKVKALIKMNK